MNAVTAWFRRHDPHGYALRRAIRTAVVVPVVLALAQLLFGHAQPVIFASFGSFAILVFVDFPGDRSARTAGYLGLVLVGATLITLGTLASRPGWLAVVGMAVAGFAVSFAGALSAAAAAAVRAALLTFVLPVTLPAGPDQIGPRILGFLLAAVISIPAALFVWPPPNHDTLRRRTADACLALADLLRATADSAGRPPRSGADADLSRVCTGALHSLREEFRRSESRPVGLSTGSRYLIRVIEDIEWLFAGIRASGRNPIPPSQSLSELVDALTGVLRAAAAALAGQGANTAAARAELDRRLAALFAVRRSLGMATLDNLVAAGPVDRMSADAFVLDTDRNWHTVGYATYLTGLTVATATAADARPVMDRILGRQAVVPAGADVDGVLIAAGRITADRFRWRSVALQNAARTGLGLALAVLIEELTGVSHGFWVVLGAMSVLRSAAVSTGATALRALLGTVAGFLVGAALILVIGTSPPVLWIALPFAALLAAYAPAAISFAAGQAAFTVVVLVLFNIIQPVGWTVGIVRIEDVALGCAAGILAGVLAWPRGAGGALRAALADAYRFGGADLRAAARADTGQQAAAKAAAGRLDDAFRGYLFERGTKNVPLEALTAVVNGATRTRLSAMAVGRLAVLVETGSVPAGPLPITLASEPVADRADLARPTRALESVREHADQIAAGLGIVGDSIVGHGQAELAAPKPPNVLGQLDLPADAHPTEVEAAARVVWMNLYLSDLDDLLGMLRGPVRMLSTGERSAGG